MKKAIVLIVMAMSLLPGLRAQDVITFKDGTDVNAKVLEVTTNEIKYKKFSNPNGPIFTVNKSDVLIIRYENGERDVFTVATEAQESRYTPLNTTEPIAEGMSYNEYHKLYNTEFYRPQPSDPYSRGWAGFASAIIPGLGQGVAGEWGRGLLFFLGNVSINLLSLTQRSVDSYGNYTYTDLYWGILATGIVYDIWCICDAVHVAKVKNMYHQDLRTMRTAQLEYSVSPFVSITPDLGHNSHPLAGLSLRLSF